MKQLVKAEILWTRRCPLRCHYCAMIDYAVPQAPVELMNQGTDRLAALGCSFFAIYGASPLMDFAGLSEFIRHAEQAGVSTTLIVDGIIKDSLQRLDILYDHGLRSLTVSWDGQTEDKAVSLKSAKGIPLLMEFKRRHDDLRDIEVVSTLTLQNWSMVLERIPSLSEAGIWFSFDFIHPSRGQPGTKSKGTAEGLRFTMEHAAEIQQIGQALLALKQSGALIHQSETYLQALINQPSLVADFAWHCTGQHFPAWLTIDADGTVLPCDDFWTLRTFKVWELTPENLAIFKSDYEREVNRHCPGCVWSTHFDAVQIKKNHFVGLSIYKHERMS